MPQNLLLSVSGALVTHRMGEYKHPRAALAVRSTGRVRLRGDQLVLRIIGAQTIFCAFSDSLRRKGG